MPEKVKTKQQKNLKPQKGELSDTSKLKQGQSGIIKKIPQGSIHAREQSASGIVTEKDIQIGIKKEH